MPLYFFDVADGKFFPDHGGTELPDLEAARQEACRVVSDILKDRESWKGHDWKVDISNYARKPLLTLNFTLSEIDHTADG